MQKDQMAKEAKSGRVVRLSRADQKARRTEQLLHAAWTMFCEKGYEGTTIDEVAAYAGVSRYPVFYAFGDKQNLFLELWKEKVKGGFDAIEPRITRGATLRSNLQALAQLLVEDHATNSYAVDSLFLVVQTIALSRPDIAEKLQAVSTNTVDYFTGIVASSRLEPGQQLRAPPRTVAAHLVAMISGLVTMRFQTHLVSVNVDDVFDTFMTIAIRQLAR
jgi:TetR/AcrR family transcriptional repressor of nem operon